jgi:hypothetical protein
MAKVLLARLVKGKAQMAQARVERREKWLQLHPRVIGADKLLRNAGKQPCPSASYGWPKSMR